MSRVSTQQLILIILLTLLSSAGCKKAPEKKAEQALPVTAERIETRDIVYRLHRVGSLEAKETVMIKCEAEGRITGIFFEEGDCVKEGQALVKIDDAKIKTTMDQLRARLRQTETQLANSLRTLERKEPLVAEGLVSQQDYDDLVARIDIEKATLVEIRAQLAHNQEMLEDTEVIAPFAGVTSERHVSLGDFVRVGDPVVRLVQLDPLEISFHVDEQYKRFLKPQQPVTVTVAAYPDRVFHGEAFFVSPDIAINTRTFLVKGRINNREHLLNPGMFAEVTIATETHKDALIVPWESVVQLENETYVYVVNNNTAHKVPITLGQISEKTAEVFGHLKVGQIVVTEGKYALADGMKVDVISDSVTEQAESNE